MANKSDISAKDILLVGGGLAVLLTLKSVFVKLGLSSGAGSQQTQNELENPNSVWKPNFWKKTGGLILRRADAENYSKTIHNAFGVFQDDFNSIMGVFSRLKAKTQVSFLADVFNQIYGEDLLTFLTNGGGLFIWDGLSDAQLKQITDLVKKLPTK